MRTFSYIIKDELGIHARPAGILVKYASSLKSNLTIQKHDGNKANLKRIFSVLGLGVKCGDKITVSVEGPDEINESKQLEKFFNENF